MSRAQKGYLFHKNAAWFLRYFDDVLVDGAIQRKQICKKLDVPYGGKYKTRKSVAEWASKILVPINAGTANPQSTMLVSEFVRSHYLPSYINVELRPASRKQFRDTWENHLAPRLRQQTLRGFRTVDAQRILDAIVAQGTLGRSSMRHCKSGLSGIFKEAKRLGIIDGQNPVADTRIGKTRTTGNGSYAYTVTEITTMLARLSEPARTIVQTAAFSGLRHSELRGLTCGSLNAQTRQLSVTQSVWNSTTSEPKTAASEAPVAVIKQLALALESHLARMGKLAQPGLPLFQAGNGKPLNLANVARRVIKPAIERCAQCHKPQLDHESDGHPFELDLSCVWRGWHAFRRGLATNLHELGVPDRTIQAILRHSDIKTTINIYIQSRDKSRSNAMDLLDAKIATCTELAPPANHLVN
jgi:integrase